VRTVLEIIQDRHSARVPYDPSRPAGAAALEAILEAARWAPTAHNMQNFEIVVVDDPKLLARIAAIRSHVSEVFLRENYLQMSFSGHELLQKRTGVLADMFPPAWRRADAKPEDIADLPHRNLGGSLQQCPTLLIVLYDARKRAPASEGDVLGFMSLGCVMQNMWLMAQSLGLAAQVLSMLSAEPIQAQLRPMVGFPAHMKVGFALRLGHPAAQADYLRVRRELHEFVHRNGY